MCCVGDIIVVNNYKKDGYILSRHSFIVLNDEGGSIQGLDFDLVCNVMSSIKNPEQRIQKLKYPGNLEIHKIDRNCIDDNYRDGYIKAEQFYYFKKDKLSYTVIGKLTPEFFEQLLKFIKELDIPISHIIDNLN